MKNKLRNKMMLMALLCGLSSSLTACNDKSAEDVSVSLEEFVDDKDYMVEAEPIEVIATPAPTEAPLFVPYDTITATTDVNIRKSAVDGEVMGVLCEDKSLRLLDTLDNGWHQVEYYGNIGYVSGNYCNVTTGIDVNRPLEKVGYVTSETTLIVPYYLNDGKDDLYVDVPALECFEIYGELYDKYLVKTNDYVGYVLKEEISLVDGTIVVVDISDQQLKLYVDNKVVLSAPVVTGKPKTPTDIGLHEIFDISGPRYLIGPDYKTWVDIMIKFNGGEGFHDASYSSCEKGGNHGWRKKQEFGGDTYLTDGSHGCVNMIREDVFELAEYVDIGTPVLIKK